MTPLYIYLAGVFVTLVFLGAWGDVSDEDTAGAWVIAIVWPIVALALSVAILCHGPFWLGKQLRILLG